jgi:lipopolysaccharide/colanic/teichoic acid biosynthesis glycosyltransferase
MANYSDKTKVLTAPRFASMDGRHAATRKAGSRRSYTAAKRIVDILGSLGGIFFLFPVYMVVALMLKWEDPKGSVFFKQMRVGKDGKPFLMYKFRSMVCNAEQILEHLLERNEVDGPMFKMKDDPRITRVGKFIRRTSLDELPQFWNVLKGDMSLVGPRPPLPREVELYTPYERQRLTVIPGCTGLWQVSGRNGLSFQEMVELDLHYIHHGSLWLDIKLMLRTLRVIVFPRNAY